MASGGYLIGQPARNWAEWAAMLGRARLLAESPAFAARLRTATSRATNPGIMLTFHS